MTMNCSACGLPPLPNQQLKQCTRCKNAWYHDTVCQRQHYPQHKEECRLAAARETNNAVPSSSSVGATAAVTARTRDESEGNDDDVHTSSEDDDDDVIQKIVYKHPLSKCQVLDSNRGRSLIAECNMYIGAHPLNPIHEDVSVDGWCEPLVPPVLMECERHSRCSYCFNLLDEQSVATRQSSQLLHHHCSRQCKDKDVNYAVEEHSIRIIHQIITQVKNKNLNFFKNTAFFQRITLLNAIIGPKTNNDFSLINGETIISPGLIKKKINFKFWK